MQQSIKKIKRSADIGLWGSVAAVILTALYHFVSPYRFYPTPHTARWMLIAGSVLAVLSVSMALLTVRKQTPIIRQTEGLEKRLDAYARHIGELYTQMLISVIVICALTVLSAQNVLLMLAMVSTLVLFLAYPNSQKIKVDLGLTDEEAEKISE